MRILIMAGGTGGHIFPALAVAKRLMRDGHTVHWLGTPTGMEVGIVASHNIPMHLVKIGGLRGKNLLTKLMAPWRLFSALLQSLRVMRTFQPDVVLGMGGYVTGPAGLAAWLLRKRLVIHEQNAIAGMTNKILARFSDRVLQGFPQAFPGNIKSHVTGNPVREEFAHLKPLQQQRGKNARLKILVFGGSIGARTLNNLMPRLLSIWPDQNRPEIWHQTGSKNISAVKQLYLDSGIQDEIKLVDFIHDMPNAYAWADIVICRAGALTVAELAASGAPSILIPYPYAVDDHQTVNAQYLAQAGAAIVIQDRDVQAENILDLLQNFLQNPDQLTAMAQAAYKCAKPDALELVVEHCKQAKQ
jgi:UDP-N-acetylglucosamine--N-acetylmuramyl-(pentapeptide) pyrophosphoryl-undecaprenol N-acetylglucosamine transferase